VNTINYLTGPAAGFFWPAIVAAAEISFSIDARLTPQTSKRKLSGANTLNSTNQRQSKTLNLMLGTAFVTWAGTFAYVYGPFVFGYIAMHGVTTGAFLLAIRRSDRQNSTDTARPALVAAGATVKQPNSKQVAQAQPAA